MYYVSSVVDAIPTVNALAGCNTTSKVGTSATFQAVMKCGYELLHSFGKSKISDQMIFYAETFLVECVSRRSERNNFDHMRFETYH